MLCTFRATASGAQSKTSDLFIDFTTYVKSPWYSGQSVARPQPTQDNITQRDQRQTSMP